MLTLVVLLTGTGCGTSEQERLPPCPRVSVLGDAATLTRFADGKGRDLVDVDYQVEVTDVLSGCTYTTNESGQDVVVVAMAPVLAAIRGPANLDREARFDYFVSVVNSRLVVLNKQRFTVSVAFPDNLTRVGVRDDDPPIIVDIPLVSGLGATSYEILIGLQLTPDELEYNRRRQVNLR